MIKLTDLLSEVEDQKLQEGWKENIMAAAIAVAGMFPAKAQKATAGEKPGMTQSIKQDTLNVNMSALFPSGKYIIKDSSELTDALTQVSDYMSKNPSGTYKVIVTSSESKVPNVDAELPNKPKVDPGYLATKRAEEIKFAIDQLVAGMKKTGAFKGTVDVNTDVKPEQGPDWHPEKGDKSTMDKFKQHQYVKLTVVAEPSKDDTVTLDPYSVYAVNGDEYYLNNQLYAIAFRDARYSDDAKKAGNLDLSKETVLLKLVKPNTSVPANAKKDSKGIYTGANYVIPYNDWYKVVGTTNMLTPEMMKKWEMFKK